MFSRSCWAQRRLIDSWVGRACRHKVNTLQLTVQALDKRYFVFKSQVE